MKSEKEKAADGVTAQLVGMVGYAMACAICEPVWREKKGGKLK